MNMSFFVPFFIRRSITWQTGCLLYINMGSKLLSRHFNRIVLSKQIKKHFLGQFFSVDFSTIPILFSRFIGQTKGNLVLIMSIQVFAHMLFMHFPDWMLPPIPSNQWVWNIFSNLFTFQAMLSKFVLLWIRFFRVFLSLYSNAYFIHMPSIVLHANSIRIGVWRMTAKNSKKLRCVCKWYTKAM